MQTNLLLDRSWRRRAIAATFVFFSLPTVAEVPPPGSISLQVPVPAYRQNACRITPPVTIADVAQVVEADELHSDRRVIVPYKQPYTGPTLVRSPQIADPDTPEGSGSLQIPSALYRNQASKGTSPQLEDVVVVEFDERLEGRRSINLSTPSYKGNTFFKAPPELPADVVSTDPPEGSGSVQIPLAQYRKDRNKIHIPLLDLETLPEADQSLNIVTDFQDLSGRTFIGTKTPEDVQVDELLSGRRSVFLKTYPYVGIGRSYLQLAVTIADVIPPLDELISGRRVVQLAPRPKYGSHIAFDAYANNRPDVVITTRFNLPLLGVG